MMFMGYRELAHTSYDDEVEGMQGIDLGIGEEGLEEPVCVCMYLCNECVGVEY